jgi:hypothetical protein
MLSKLAHLLNGRLDGSRSPHSTVCPSTYVRRPPSINVHIQYSLTVWFDHTFLPKHLWGSLSAFCNYPQRCNLEDLFQPFALSPRFFTNWSNLSSLPPTSVLIIHSLTVRFDHTFFPKHLWGSISAFCNYPQRFQSWGSLSAFCTIPKIFTNWSNLPVSEHL